MRGGKANNRSNADTSTKTCMTNITTAKKILNGGNTKYSEEQVKLILETLSMMASLQLITEEEKTKKNG